MVSSRWLKGRFFHELLPEATITSSHQGQSGSDNGSEVSPILRLLKIAQLNDTGAKALVDGRISLALHIFAETLSLARKFTAEDANSIRCRNLVFSELAMSTTTTSSDTAQDQNYLLPVDGVHESAIFSKAILLCLSNRQASVENLIDVLQFHLGLSRHIQAWDSPSAARRQVLLGMATKRYKNVQGSGLVRTAARCNLVSCAGPSFLQGFLEAYDALEDPDEIAEFRNCITHCAQAA